VTIFWLIVAFVVVAVFVGTFVAMATKAKNEARSSGRPVHGPDAPDT